MPVTHYWEKINHVKFGHMKNAKKQDCAHCRFGI